MRPLFHRSREISRLKYRLEREGYPRLLMAMLVSITGGAGFLASVLLLDAGLREMWARYLVSVGIAYAVFLCLLWLWLRNGAESYADLPDISGSLPSGEGSSTHSVYCGHEGGFDGGGASGNYDSSLGDIPTTADGTVGDVLAAAGDADDFAIPLLIVLIAATVLLSSLWIIYSAPVLFAELVVDGVLAASLYRRLRGLESRHWLETALRRTVWPFLITAVVAAGAGAAMKQHAPEARSLGEVLHHVSPGR